jgi:hypothetical protein
MRREGVEQMLIRTSCFAASLTQGLGRRLPEHGPVFAGKSAKVEETMLQGDLGDRCCARQVLEQCRVYGAQSLAAKESDWSNP